MEYVEILRTRRVLFWFAVSLLATLVLNVLSFGHIHSDGDMPSHGSHVPFSAFLVAATVISYIMVACVAPGLSNESNTIAISWTRPIARAAIAWRYIAVDFATIAVCFCVALGAILLAIWAYGFAGAIKMDADAPYELALGVGTVVMWYALIVAASARFPGRGGMIAGLSWGAVILVGGMWSLPLPWLIHDLITALNYLSPLAYLSASAGDASNHGHHAIALTGPWLAIVPWCIGIAALVAGVRLWSTREA
jgi:hypothetical protein